MAWVHDSGYAPAYDHTGYPVAVQLDGSETGSSSAASRVEVIGWRSGCDCGWRGMQFYARGEWPSPSGLAPEAVDGWETGTAAFAEWQWHLDRTLPELAVHDLARQLADVEARLEQACWAARISGVTWTRITAVAGAQPVVETMRRREADERVPPSLRSAAPRAARHDLQQGR